MESIVEEKPTYLYKIISLCNWQKSEREKIIFLTLDDKSFVHLAKKDQLYKVISKFFANEKTVVILKLQVAKIQGNLVYEKNPGGINKYYHLYDGFIPFEAICEVRFMNT